MMTNDTQAGAEIVGTVEKWRLDAAKACELEVQNRLLRQQLLLMQGPPQTPTEGGVNWEDKYSDLRHRYDELKRVHAGCEPFIQRAKEKTRAAKKSIKLWQAYIDSKATLRGAQRSVATNADVRSANIGESEVCVGKDGNTPCVLTPTSRASPAIVMVLPDQADNLPAEPQVVADTEADNTPSSSRESKRCSGRVTSSQTTEVDIRPQQSPDAGDQIDSDDEPVFVSVKCLKRKRGFPLGRTPPPTLIKRENGARTEAVSVKSEDFSSPEASLQQTHPLQRQETSDLNAVGDNVDTPRKRQRFEEMLQHSRLSSFQPFQPAGHTFQISLPRKYEDLLHAVGVNGAGRPRALFQAPSFSDSGMLPPPAGCDISPHPSVKCEPGADQHEPLRPAPEDAGRGRALQPLSVNAQTRSQIGRIHKVTSSRKAEYDGSASKLAFLAEDGDRYKSRSEAAAPSPIEPNTAKNKSHRRLGTLLDAPPTDRALLPPRNPRHLEWMPPHSRLANTAQTNDSTRQPTPTTWSINENSPALPPSNGFRLPRGLGVQPSPFNRKDKPLREQPLHKLTLEDFRVNPKYQESEFAFADTIRSRDQRRRLPGCTNPSCCGNAFLKAVEIAGAPITVQKSGLFDSSQESLDNDAQLLKDYLGPDFAQIMHAYGCTRRQELLAQARAYAFANEHGKHRQAFQRRGTPPGFWRTDMPTTQEGVADRLEAQHMIRKKVEERWLEAMRKEGRWIFRDE